MIARISPGNGFQRWRRIVLSSTSLISALLLIPGASHAQSPAPAIGADPSQLLSYVRYQDGLLSVKVHQLPLTILLQEISRLSGIDISIDPSIVQQVSLEFDNLPMEEGLKRLLRSHNIVLVYRDPSAASPSKTGIEKAIVLPAGKANAEKAPDADAQADPEKAARLARAKVLTSLATRSDVQTTLDLYLHTPDPGVKQQALDTLLASMTEEHARAMVQLLEDPRFQPEDLEAVLSPLKEVVSPEDAAFLLSVLRDRVTRQHAASFFRQLKVRKEETR
jgi:hypothetical protein